MVYVFLESLVSAAFCEFLQDLSTFCNSGPSLYSTLEDQTPLLAPNFEANKGLKILIHQQIQ